MKPPGGTQTLHMHLHGVVGAMHLVQGNLQTEIVFTEHQVTAHRCSRSRLKKYSNYMTNIRQTCLQGVCEHPSITQRLGIFFALCRADSIWPRSSKLKTSWTAALCALAHVFSIFKRVDDGQGLLPAAIDIIWVYLDFSVTAVLRLFEDPKGV